MENEIPNYYAIIPANVRYDTNLRDSEKLMYGEITTLTTKTGECWASNGYFAKLYGVTPQAVSKWLKDLEKCGYIHISYKYKGKQIKTRIITLGVSTPRLGVSTPRLGGYQQKFKDNNTSNNNTRRKTISERFKQNFKDLDRFYLSSDEED